MSNKKNGVKRQTKGGKRPHHFDAAERFAEANIKYHQASYNLGQTFGIQYACDLFAIECKNHGVSAKTINEIWNEVQKDLDKHGSELANSTDDERTYELEQLDRQLRPIAERAGVRFADYTIRYSELLDYLKNSEG